MTDSIQVLRDKVLFSGKLIDIASRTLRVSREGVETVYSIEVARRPPGVRILVHNAGKYLLLKEFRSELGRWDYRLAGGKIFESQSQHLAFLVSGDDILDAASGAVVAEAREELGIKVHSATILRKSSAGATIDWDLYFFQVLSFEEIPQGPSPESTELLVAEWHGHTSVLELIKSGEFSEDRSIGLLLQDMLQRGILQANDNQTA